MKEVPKAMEVLSKALKEDEGYYIGWQANIAMSFIDEFRASLGDCVDYEVLHEIANDSAHRFLKQLVN